MAALIENNEGHIEHMVAVVSPFSPFLSLAHTHLVCLSLPHTKGPLKLCPSEVKIYENQRTLSKLFFFFPSPFFFWQVNVHTVSERSTDRPVSWWQNVNPTETGSGRNTGLSTVLMSCSFVLCWGVDICSSFPRSLLSLRAEEQKCQHILPSHTSQMDGHQYADNDLHVCVITKERFCPLFDLVSERSRSIFFLSHTRDISAGRTCFSGGLNMNVSWSQELSLQFSRQSCDTARFQNKS